MTVSRLIAVLFAGSLALSFSSSAHAGFFLKIEGVSGETEDLPSPPPAPPQLAAPRHQPSAVIHEKTTLTEVFITTSSKPSPARRLKLKK